MNKRSTPFTVAVMTTLMLATIVMTIIALSNNSSNKLIKTNIVGARAPACGSATGEFDLVDDLDIVGTAMSSTKEKAIEQAKQNLKSKQQEMEALADPKLSCGQDCTGDTTTCHWQQVNCDARKSDNNWKAVCTGEVKCNKTCNKK